MKRCNMLSRWSALAWLMAASPSRSLQAVCFSDKNLLCYLKAAFKMDGHNSHLRVVPRAWDFFAACSPAAPAHRMSGCCDGRVHSCSENWGGPLAGWISSSFRLQRGAPYVSTGCCAHLFGISPLSWYVNWPTRKLTLPCALQTWPRIDRSSNRRTSEHSFCMFPDAPLLGVQASIM